MKDTGPRAFLLDAAYWEALYFRDPCSGASLAAPPPKGEESGGCVTGLLRAGETFLDQTPWN